MLKFGILTVSTTCSRFPEKDLAGPALETEIKKTFSDCQITFKQIVTDDEQKIADLLRNVARLSTCDILITVGGTGFAPSDVTPEATRSIIDKEAPGLSLILILKSLNVTDMAMLSRPVCGIKNKTIIINFPGSAKAAIECFGFIKSSLPHAVALLQENDIKVRSVHESIQNPKGDNNISSADDDSKVQIKAGASRLRKSEYPMLDVEEAQRTIFNTISTFEDIEVIPIESALGRILAEDIKAAQPVPAFRASIKDGYAVRAEDGTGQRKVRAVTAAGDTPEILGLQSGEIIRISTGAPLPPGADAVVQVEDTTLVKVTSNGEEEKIVNIIVPPKIGQDIREIGSDIQENTVVLEKQNPITAAYVGVLAMLGFNVVKVVRRPSIGIISTGNELINPSEPLKAGKIYDSNKVTLLCLLKSYGYNATDCGIARDTPNSVKATLTQAFENNDLLISSGGVSMGEYDLLKQVLVDDFGATIEFGRLNMKPGKPTVFATLKFKGQPKLMFALPGNPVSCCVTSLLFVIPTLKHMEGDKVFKGWPTIYVKLEGDIVNRDPRPEYVRLSIVRDNNNQLLANSTGNQISSRLNSMVNANGLLLVPGQTTYMKDTVKSVYLFGQLF